MLLTKLLQKDYTKNSDGYQLKLPLNLETIIPDTSSGSAIHDNVFACVIEIKIQKTLKTDIFREIYLICTEFFCTVSAWESGGIEKLALSLRCTIFNFVCQKV